MNGSFGVIVAGNNDDKLSFFWIVKSTDSGFNNGDNDGTSAAAASLFDDCAQGAIIFVGSGANSRIRFCTSFSSDSDSAAE